MIRRDLGSDVPRNLIRGPYVPSDHIDNRLVEHSLIVELYERNEDAFLEDVMVVRGDAAADIGMMKYACRKGDKLFLVKDGTHDANVIEVTGQCPGIIGDENVTGLVKIYGIFINKVFYSKGHRT
jgi:CO dehydrogenase/acetyl-CoA synthase alpha subunit